MLSKKRVLGRIKELEDIETQMKIRIRKRIKMLGYGIQPIIKKGGDE